MACWLGKVGAAVTLIARSEENLNEAGDKIRRLGGEPLVCKADVSQYDACRNAVDKTLDRFGRIDAVVNNAAIVQPISGIVRTDPADWRYNIEVNLFGPLNLISGLR